MRANFLLIERIYEIQSARLRYSQLHIFPSAFWEVGEVDHEFSEMVCNGFLTLDSDQKSNICC